MDVEFRAGLGGKSGLGILVGLGFRVYGLGFEAFSPGFMVEMGRGFVRVDGCRCVV